MDSCFTEWLEDALVRNASIRRWSRNTTFVTHGQHTELKFRGMERFLAKRDYVTFG